MLSKKQATAMLSLQHGMNSKVDSNWLTTRYPYLRAVVIEGAEAIEHHGWKWWKHQEHDRSQLQMELIDIWHFMLSELLLETEGRLAQACTSLLQGLDSPEDHQILEFDGKSYPIHNLNLISKLELLIGTSVARRIELGLFEAIMADCDMDWNELFRQYVGKNVLNFFRQDNGYKQGNYRKIWDGKEDNEHLVEILERLDARDDQFQDNLYAALSSRYQGQV
ncbi:MAG: dUTP diphosphatase [Gammaproteobacteria bacterium]|nr:dUTP diphosphatase [Gammaproteobacteria bacterium]